MVHNGQKFRRVYETDVWEIVGPRLGAGHEKEWFLIKVDGGKVESVHERDLESGSHWTPVPDDA